MLQKNFNSSNLIRFFCFIGFTALFFISTTLLWPQETKKTLKPLTEKATNTFPEVEKNSPLKGLAAGTALAKVERGFHKIFEVYKDRVVFISTEKHITRPKNPFANDPYFQKFFGPNGDMPKKKRRKHTGLGTGFILSKDGYICTNHHVIAKVDAIRVRAGRKEYKAKLIGADTVTDLALLKVESPNDFKPVYFGNSSNVRVGDWAIAIGNPFGFDKTFTVGVVSAVRGDRDELGNSYIQTDASINQGNSGGPLLNLDGEVIGVNRMIFAKSGGGSLGIGFSIPISTAKIVLGQLKKYGKMKWGYIGIKIIPVTRSLMHRLGAKNTSGALIVQLAPNGPAKRGGLRPGDIVLRVNHERIKNVAHLIRSISYIGVGETATLKVLRKRKIITVEITIGEKP